MAGKVLPFETGVRKGDFMIARKNQRPQNGYLQPLTNGIGGHERGSGELLPRRDEGAVTLRRQRRAASFYTGLTILPARHTLH